ncbi:MAG: SRPBCC family protein [Myxococcota bacterium]
MPGARDLDALHIDADVARARTLPGWVYDDPAWFDRLRDRVFPRTWHLRPIDARPASSGDLTPWELLPATLDEPLLLSHDGTRLRCLSNVCTHRGKVLIERPCNASNIRCGYHGRRFELDGTLRSAPGFDRCPDFPTKSDHLPSAALGQWRTLLFGGLAPAMDFDAFFGPVATRIDPLVPDALRFDAERSEHYEMNANWALYCDNYLEGFHIPYVHTGLNAALDWSEYRIETFAWGSVQIARAKPDELAFDLPPGHPDHGTRIAAYYFWLFPCTMVNVYPWGLSLNVVLPQGPRRTKVVFMRYVWDETRAGTGAGGALDEVEYEDEAVVEACARGVRSRLYDRGRYAPGHEDGVHHFHRLLVAASNAQI